MDDLPDYLLNRRKIKLSNEIREDSKLSPAITNYFKSVKITEDEKAFLQAAESGDFDTLKELAEARNNLKLNCKDYLGQSALQLSVKGDHRDIIQYLLDRSKLKTIDDALLVAVLNENLDLCEFILNHKVYSDKNFRLELEFSHDFYDQDESNPFISSDLTPIILAAQMNNFEIVKLLLERGFSIQTPHEYFCDCTGCSNHKEYDRVVHSKSRLNAYQGLASPAYLSLSTDEPILLCFRLSKQLLQLSNDEKQYSHDYMELCNKCKEFAVELLELCRNQEEVLAALHGEADVKDLSRIKMSLHENQKKFIAYSSTQEHLLNIWYGDFTWLRNQSGLVKMMLIPISVCTMPIIVLIYLLAPKSKIGLLIKIPVVKFINHAAAYVLFLCLLVLATYREQVLASYILSEDMKVTADLIISGIVLVYVAGLMWGEIKQVAESGVKEYFMSIWNWMDVTMILLFIIAFGVHIAIVLGDVSLQKIIKKPDQLSNILYSIANVLCFTRIVYYLPANETFGQLQISYGRMLKDVGKFLVIYAVVMVAFLCGLSGLYSHVDDDPSSGFTTIWESIDSLFWATFGMGDSQAPRLQNPTYQMTMITGYILYGIFILAAVVVLFNMLIAMMTNTFEEIQVEEDVEWKFARAQLWMSYIEDGCTLPVPFNLIPTPKGIYHLFLVLKKKFKCSACCDEPKKIKFKTKHRDNKAIMGKVVMRYIHLYRSTGKEEMKSELSEFKQDLEAEFSEFQTSISDRLENLDKALSKTFDFMTQVKHHMFGNNNNHGLRDQRSNKMEIMETNKPFPKEENTDDSSSTNSIKERKPRSLKRDDTRAYDPRSYSEPQPLPRSYSPNRQTKTLPKPEPKKPVYNPSAPSHRPTHSLPRDKGKHIYSPNGRSEPPYVREEPPQRQEKQMRPPNEKVEHLKMNDLSIDKSRPTLLNRHVNREEPHRHEKQVRPPNEKVEHLKMNDLSIDKSRPTLLNRHVNREEPQRHEKQVRPPNEKVEHLKMNDLNIDRSRPTLLNRHVSRDLNV